MISLIAKCHHNNFKSQCKECGGSALCKHNIQKSSCKECGGSTLCKANKEGLVLMEII